MHKTTVYIPEDVMTKLKIYVAKHSNEKLRLSETITQAIVEYLDKHNK